MLIKYVHFFVYSLAIYAVLMFNQPNIMLMSHICHRNVTGYKYDVASI